ncbi:MAG: DUF881 domain-containing protein [Clostridia bacterium]|nr:DUF881 domain-containing protein [Clostridia bacterium]
MEKGKITISIVVFFISIMLVSLMFIQFRTVEETNSLGIEDMREDELRQEMLLWKAQYNDVDQKLQANKEKIDEYTNMIQNNQQSSELLDKELQEYNMLVGKTNVMGEGVELTLTDDEFLSYSASNLISLVNELKYAGAEAISINGQRIINSTDIVSINSRYILINGERVASPYTVKAIGNRNDFNTILNFPNEGYVPSYQKRGYKIDMSLKSDIRIEAYNKEITLKYVQEKKEE